MNDKNIQCSNTKMNYNILAGIIALIFGICNYYHISYMHEKHVMFSHLSTVEREMFFRTENGFYYSFYKQLVTVHSFRDAIDVLIHDNLTEYPTVINSLKRFNLYPEIVTAISYRIFYWIMEDVMGISTSQCYVVNREGLSSVINCDGLGDSAVFYVNFIHLLNGVAMIGVFLSGWLLSNYRIFGGIMSCVLFLFNHRQCTRVQWNAPLRENFSYPFIVIQQLMVMAILKKQNLEKVGAKSKIILILTTLAALLSWQFAQFALFTQSIALFITYLITANRHNDKRRLIKHIYISLLLADVCNLILQFANSLLLVAPFRSCYLVCLFIIMFEPDWCISVVKNSILAPIRWLLWTFIMIVLTLASQKFISWLLDIHSDNHMWDILRSKFTTFQSFDSLIYTCAPEFDFYKLSSLNDLIKTGLLILAVLVILDIIFVFIRNWLTLLFTCNKSKEWSDSWDIWIDNYPHYNSDTYYIFFQTLAYTIMAMLIMRLKLFFTPQLCIVASILFNDDWWHYYFNRFSILCQRFNLKKIHCPKFHIWMVYILILAACSYNGIINLKDEWSIEGSYSNWDQEEMIDFINKNTDKTSAFTGQMAIMATVRLTTGRPITLHPHYEDIEARNRVKMAYSIYSRKSIEQVWRVLRTNLSAEYLIYEHGYCVERSGKPACSYFNMWDTIDAPNKPRQPLCYRFENSITSTGYDKEFSTHFQLIFRSQSSSLVIFKILNATMSVT